MGNCLRSRPSSTMVWAGDDWGSVTEAYNNSNNVNNKGDASGERQRLLGSPEEEEKKKPSISSSSSSSSPGSFREVKIKITKRELEELMASVHMQGLTMEQVLARLVSNYDYNYEGNYESHHFNHHDPLKSWKPALQSIPEVD